MIPEWSSLAESPTRRPAPTHDQARFRQLACLRFASSWRSASRCSPPWPSGGPRSLSPPHRVGLLFPRPGPTRQTATSTASSGQPREDTWCVEGRNICSSSSGGSRGRTTKIGLALLAAELAQQKVDVIVAFGPAASRACRPAGKPSRCPGRELSHRSRCGGGRGSSRAWGGSGGNVTGMTVESTYSAGKQLELPQGSDTGHLRVGIGKNRQSRHAGLLRTP